MTDTPQMCVPNTPLRYWPEWGLWVKHEEKCCPGGPHFSKTRGVFAHARKRNEELIGVLDTTHSFGGWAVAAACKMLGKKCRLYYPIYKAEATKAREQATPVPLKMQQQKARDLGAELVPLPAGRSAVLYHQAKRDVTERGGYMFPNALKLSETVEETALELQRTMEVHDFLYGGETSPDIRDVNRVLISASSGTIAAGVICGLFRRRWQRVVVTVHLGYSRPKHALLKYMGFMSGLHGLVEARDLQVVDEGYAYADEARPGPTPGWPCNLFYDLKAFRWYAANRSMFEDGKTLFWNVG